MSTVVLRQELDAARAETTTARASEEAERLQLARLMDEQLAQNQTIDAVRRQVEASNNSAQQAQALLRSNQEQQLQNARMLSPTNYPSGQGGNIGNTPFYSTLIDSFDGTAHKGASWSGILPYWLAGGSGAHRKYALYVWPR
jgi:multidrug efflux pump subunit AcrA (membrane-fusion protein)